MNFRTKATPNAPDADAQRVVPMLQSYGENELTNPFWFVETITKRYGSEPSSMLINMPASGYDAVAPTMAGVAKGPMDNAKIFTRCKAVLNGAVLFCGSVVIPNENLDSDGCTIEALDDRYLLEGVNIVGSFWHQDTLDAPCYRQAEKAWFNKDGLANRTQGSSGLTYLFCTPELGLADGRTPNDPSINAPGVATHWDPESIIKYLSETTNPLIVKGFVSAFPEYSFVPPQVTFPAAIGNGLHDFMAGDQLPQIGARKAPEMIFDATPLVLAIQKVFEAAGPFALDVEYTPDGTSILTRVYSHFIKHGYAIPRATGTAAAFATDGSCIGGNLKRDGRQLFNEVVVSGDHQILETRGASTDAATLDDEIVSGVEIFKAWSDKTKTAAIQYFNDCVTNGTPVSLPEVLQLFPNLFESFYHNPDKNYNKGTSEESKPFCHTANRHILPHIVTRLVADAGEISGPNLVLTTSFRSIVIETSTTEADVPEGDGTHQTPQNTDNGVSGASSGDEGGDGDAAAFDAGDAGSNMGGDSGGDPGAGSGGGAD